MPLTRRRALASLISGGLLMASGCSMPGSSDQQATPPKPATNANWPMYRQNPKNTGHRDDGGSVNDDAGVAWEHSLSANPANGAAIDSDSLYIGERFPGELYSIDLRSGDENWRFSSAATDDLTGFPTVPALTNEYVYAAAQNGNLHCLSRADGDRQWTVQANHGFSASPTVVDDTVYAFSDRVYAIDPSGGEIRWRESFDDPILATPAIADDDVYVATSTGHLESLHLPTRETNWSQSLEGEVHHATVADSGRVFVADSTGTIYAFDDADGTELWSFGSQYAISSAPAVGDNAVIVATDEPALYALNPRTGEVKWDASETDFQSAAPTIIDGTVYSSNDESVVGRTVESGDIVLEFAVEHGIVTSPIIAADTLYVGCQNNRIYAIN